MMKNKKGVTLAEVVIAMAVVAILSISAITVIEEGFKKTNESAIYSEARQISNNVYEAFKYSSSFSSFNQAMNLTGSTYDVFRKEPSIEKYTLTYDVSTIEVKVVLTYYANEAYLDVECYDEDDDVIFSYSYTKLIYEEVTIDE